MKKYVYPGLLFSDEADKSYTVLIPDLDIVGSGDTVEEAYLSAEDFLKTFLQFAIKMEATVPNASSYEETVKKNSKRIVLLTDAEIADDLQLDEGEKAYKNFVQKYVVDAED